ncbi:MAG TPA: hypothetical protein VHM72_01435 [Solirubrobacteraceae bacterium]|nr:hypothetical protein [Solirubrobacteraceae bacterium]
MLDLSVAVRAQQHAFRGFRAQLAERSAEALLRDAELLRLRIDVVKLERRELGRSIGPRGACLARPGALRSYLASQ